LIQHLKLPLNVALVLNGRDLRALRLDQTIQFFPQTPRTIRKTVRRRDGCCSSAWISIEAIFYPDSMTNGSKLIASA
jgi:hypothetical protein